MILASKAILIVDDEPLTRAGLLRTIEAWSAGRHQILSAENGKEALEILSKQQVHLLLTDIRMPEVSGLQVVESMKAKGNEPVVIVLSGHPDFQYAQKSIQLGVVNYLLKPVSKQKLLEAIEEALKIEENLERVETMKKMVDPQLMSAAVDNQQYSPPVQEAMRYVEEHLQSTIGLRDVAAHIHLNSSYFSVLFKEQTNMTFSEFVTRSRLQKAKELLIHTKLPIAEIAERVGYVTSKYFIKLFKDYEGKSPSQYRKDTTGGKEGI